MAQLKVLSEDEFNQTFSPPMQDVTDSASVLVDIWPYAEEVIKSDFSGLDHKSWDVEYVYEDCRKKFQHILIGTSIENAYIVIVICTELKSVIGHHFLNLNKKYGLGH